jgi:hypothetical protein
MRMTGYALKDKSWYKRLSHTQARSQYSIASLLNAYKLCNPCVYNYMARHRQMWHVTLRLFSTECCSMTRKHIGSAYVCRAQRDVL